MTPGHWEWRECDTGGHLHVSEVVFRPRSRPTASETWGQEWCQALVFSLGPGLRVMSGPGGGPGCALTVWVTGLSDVPAEPGLRARLPRGEQRGLCTGPRGSSCPTQPATPAGHAGQARASTPSRASLMWGAAGCAQEHGDPARALSPQTPALGTPPIPGYR